MSNLIQDQMQIVNRVNAIASRLNYQDFTVKVTPDEFDYIVNHWPDVYFQMNFIRSIKWIDKLLRRKPKVVTFNVDQSQLESMRADWKLNHYFVWNGYKIGVVYG